MAASKGFDKAINRLEGVGKRALNPREALQAIGREAVKTHKGYFRSAAGQSVSGGGPPGAPWPGLEAKTIKYKKKRGRTRKLIDEGTLKGGYVYKRAGNAIRILNEAKHAYFLQIRGVGKKKGGVFGLFGKKKKFIVVATNLRKQDPELLKKIKFMAGRFLRTGRSR